ncbi:N-methyltryptophan oxidase [Paraoerskovia sediminicola]|uniref:N-methyltryptophan oxidase n=1 Tax=Paraoerskovia sediminicola TaxID=1138587 RepID=A0ABM8G0H2_9CELL|nr:N-methyl-L-tryptophan oxidase [Paraoerskovia sediminicola]BDZ41599.1 N-methyltryptophan oxidase [Paraoerskovia sediminicola]
MSRVTASDASFDAIVVGVGSMGGAALNELAARGLRGLGIESFAPGHDRGSAHGGSRIVRQAYFEGEEYVPLLRRAYEGWRRLEESSGRDLLTLCGGINIGDRASSTFAGSLAAARAHGLEHEVLDAAEIRSRFPTMDPPDDALGLYEAAAGFVRPEETTIANAEVAVRHGATLRTGERVRSWRATPGGGVEVTTDAATYGADRLVVTPGAWVPDILADLGLPIVVERQVFYWFAPDTARVPSAAWSHEQHPVYIEETHGNGQVYGFPLTDGPDGGFKLAFFRHGRPTSADDLDRVVTEDEVAAMRVRAVQLFPDLTGPLLRAAACMYSTTPDEHFVVGPHPEHPQVSIACGFSGHGFKFVPVIGEALADLVVDGRTDLPIGLFDPTREALRRPAGA